jgi:twitching motility protein PilT
VPDAVAREVSQPIVVEEATRAAHDGSLLALLQAARSAGATDVVLVSDRPALVRRVGALRPGSKQPLSTATIAKMVLPLLSPAQRAQYDERGYADFASELPGVARLRVNVCRQRTGIKATFRILAVHAPSLEQLGLPRDIQVISRYHQGLVVVSGPSGHGKTTTMAAIVDYFNTHKAVHIITVEDPVEILHPVKRAIVSQREVGIHTASFYAALKAALREDPDVIAIGELRDRETVEMALSAAETGHLVVATMSTPSGAKTIDRMINLFPPDDQPQVRATLAGALKLVVSQRLLPAAGGQGMVAAAEMITGNFALWNLIKDNKLFQLSSLMQRGRAAGMLRLEDSLSELVQAGAVDLAVAQSYADDPRLVIAEAPAPAAEPAKPARGFMRG